MPEIIAAPSPEHVSGIYFVSPFSLPQKIQARLLSSFFSHHPFPSRLRQSAPPEGEFEALPGVADAPFFFFFVLQGLGPLLLWKRLFSYSKAEARTLPHDSTVCFSMNIPHQ